MSKPFRICVIMQWHSSWMGGTEYTRNIIRALATLPRDTRSTFELDLIVGQHTDREFISEMEGLVHRIYYAEQDLPGAAFFAKPRWSLAARLPSVRHCRYTAFLKMKGFDFAYPYYGRNIASRFTGSAAWIPDFQHRYLKEYFSAEEVRSRDVEYSAMASRASMVVLSSQSAGSDFRKFFPEFAHKARILPFRTVPSQAWYTPEPSDTRNRYALPPKFFLACNQFWQHKNHLLIFEALRLLKARAVRPVVVCTGLLHDYRRPDYSSKILQTIQQMGLANQVHLLGVVPRMDQIQLIRSSIGIIQPSLFEGWSTVVEDARCMGKTIVLSDIAVHVEQDPPHGHFFERHSAEGLVKLLEELWLTSSPGPSRDRENEAYRKSVDDVSVFGRGFLQLAASIKMLRRDRRK